jgi:dihydroorotate dehydrogenase (NAD+) catalytic subunit
VPASNDVIADTHVDLSVRLGQLVLKNPVLVASGTFGYAREMVGLVDLARLGGILPKTITASPRAGNPPPRTCETAAGLLNSIGLDNDGIDAFIDKTLPYLANLGAPIVVSIAGKTHQEFVDMAARLDGLPGVDAIELNISCPNVTGGADFGTDGRACESVVSGVRKVCNVPILAKLTPNVTDIVPIAVAAEAGGADALSLVNTCLGMAINWRKRRSMLGRLMGGLSGPAIKPIALRLVYQARQKVKIPIVGIGGIATVDDAMDFFVVGATAIQVGTASFYNPSAAIQILDALPSALEQLHAKSVAEVVGTLAAD